MTKAELADEDARYRELMTAAHRAEAQGLFGEAVSRAKEAWSAVDGMIQFEKRFGAGVPERISAIEFVLRYAPLLLDYKSLDAVEELLVTCKRIGRTVTEDPDEKLAAAREKLKDCHRLWTLFERSGAILQSDLRGLLGGDQDQWREVSMAWCAMGLALRDPEGSSYRVSLKTRMGQVVPAKCPACGKLSTAPKSMFFENTACPECGKSVRFVLKAANA